MRRREASSGVGREMSVILFFEKCFLECLRGGEDSPGAEEGRDSRWQLESFELR